MDEQWRDIPGYEGSYQVSDMGNVKAVSFVRRYTHWRNGVEMFRTTKEKLLSQNKINSGYLIVHLYEKDKRKAFLVHRLVAEAFIGVATELTVNHKNGDKRDNRAANLEWSSYTDNHIHAVGLGLNTLAIRVRDPATGIIYGSINRAMVSTGFSKRRVKNNFERV